MCTKETDRLTKDHVFHKVNPPTTYLERFNKLKQIYKYQNTLLLSERMSFMYLHFIVCIMSNCFMFSDLTWIKKILKVQRKDKIKDIYIATLGLPEKCPEWVVTSQFLFHIPIKNLFLKTSYLC